MILFSLKMIFSLLIVALISSSNCAENPQPQFKYDCTTPSGETGQCLTIEQCPNLMPLWKDTSMAHKLVLDNLLRDRQCGYEGVSYKVCCVFKSRVQSNDIMDNDDELRSSFNIISQLFKNMILKSNELNQSKHKAAYGFISYLEPNPKEAPTQLARGVVVAQPPKSNKYKANDIQTDDICTVTFESNDIKGLEGRCIAPYKCKYFASIWKQITLESLPVIKKIMDDSRCGFDTSTNSALICCPLEDEKEDESTTIPPQYKTFPPPSNIELQSFNEINGDDSILQDLEQATQPAYVFEHRNLHLLSKDCGNSDTERVHNGHVAKIREYPWMALLKLKRDDQIYFGCGGSIINQRYILTAAHCVRGPSFILSGVRVGEHTISTDFDCDDPGDCDSAYDYDVENVTVHPNYNSILHENDIALIRLTKPITYEGHVLPICLPLGEELRNKNLLGEKVIGAGWGFTENGTKSDVLLWATLTVVPKSKCAQVFRMLMRNGMSDTQICAGGDTNKDTCKGDSGGPLMAIYDVDEVLRMVQFGLVSYGFDSCGHVGIPAVYTDVTKYVDWILDHLEESYEQSQLGNDGLNDGQLGDDNSATVKNHSNKNDFEKNIIYILHTSFVGYYIFWKFIY
ncbi:CLIP domain-containing serine protease HP8-like [Arctopsyche grandis]|uniref:CLIP domain-containing serine protease HP8-like n=1 Tax=Arctopsyche grandis TaxID=121162 RepID=UPI00406D636F